MRNHRGQTQGGPRFILQQFLKLPRRKICKKKLKGGDLRARNAIACIRKKSKNRHDELTKRAGANPYGNWINKKKRPPGNRERIPKKEIDGETMREGRMENSV